MWKDNTGLDFRADLVVWTHSNSASVYLSELCGSCNEHYAIGTLSAGSSCSVL